MFLSASVASTEKVGSSPPFTLVSHPLAQLSTTCLISELLTPHALLRRIRLGTDLDSIFLSDRKYSNFVFSL